MTLFTTNKEWDKDFINRTRGTTKHLPLRKQLSVKNLAVYWTPKANELCANMDKDKARQTMEAQILKDREVLKSSGEFLGAVSATIRMTHRDDKNLEMSKNRQEARFEVFVELSPLDFRFNKLQLKELVTLLDLFKKRWRLRAAFWKKMREEVAGLLKRGRKQCLEDFKRMYQKLVEYEEKDSSGDHEKALKEALGASTDFEKFKCLTLGLGEKDIMEATREVAVELAKERAKEMEEEKSKKEGKPWFKRLVGWVRRHEEIDLHDDTKSERSEEFERQLRAEELEAGSSDSDAELKSYTVSNREVDISSMALNVSSEGGSLYLSETGTSKDEPGIRLDFKGLNLKLTSWNEKLSMQISFLDCECWLRTRLTTNKQEQFTDVLMMKRTEHYQASELFEEVLTVSTLTSWKGMEQENLTTIECDGLQIIWKPQILEQVESFLRVFQVDRDTSLLEELELLQKIRDESQDKFGTQLAVLPSRNVFSLVLKSSVIIVPCNQKGIDNGCWALGFQHMNFDRKFYEKASSGKQVSSSTFNESIKAILQGIKFEYRPYQDMAESQAGRGVSTKQRFEVIKEVNVEVYIERASHKREKQSKEETELVSAKVRIGNVAVNLTPEITSKLMKINEVFEYKSLGILMSKPKRSSYNHQGSDSLERPSEDNNQQDGDPRLRRSVSEVKAAQGNQKQKVKIIGDAVLQLGCLEVSFGLPQGKSVRAQMQNLSIKVEKQRSLTRADLRLEAFEVLGHSGTTDTLAVPLKLISSVIPQQRDSENFEVSRESIRRNIIEFQVNIPDKLPGEVETRVQVESTCQYLEVSLEPELIKDIKSVISSISAHKEDQALTD